jgi:hypothetical protein
VRVGKGFVLALKLYGESTGSGGGLQVIVQIEVLGWPTT